MELNTELNTNESSFDSMTPNDFKDDYLDRQSDYVNDLNQERSIIIKGGFYDI